MADAAWWQRGVIYQIYPRPFMDSDGDGVGRGRDPERTPMPWEDGPGAGFTTGRPWLPRGPGGRPARPPRRRGVVVEPG